MGQLEVGYALMAINPFGGLFVAIPLAVWKLHWPVVLAVCLTTLLSFTQVLAVELGWGRLIQWPRFVRFVESKRSERITRALESRWAMVWVALLSPWLGPWLVMALSRFSGLAFRRVGPALLFGLLYVSALTGAASVYAPELLPPDVRRALP